MRPAAEVAALRAAGFSDEWMADPQKGIRKKAEDELIRKEARRLKVAARRAAQAPERARLLAAGKEREKERAALRLVCFRIRHPRVWTPPPKPVKPIQPPRKGAPLMAPRRRMTQKPRLAPDYDRRAEYF